MYDWFKRAYLTNTDVGTGMVTGLTLGLIIATFLTGVGIASALVFKNPILFYLFMSGGIISGAVSGVHIYNEGLFDVPIKHRGVLLWLGTRQKGAAFEVEEGRRWKLPTS